MEPQRDRMNGLLRYPTLLLASTSPLSGKTAFAVGIGRALQGQGYAVGYCQPLLIEHEHDHLAPDHIAFVRAALRLRGETDAGIAPVHFTAANMVETLRDAGGVNGTMVKRAVAAFRTLALDKDVMLLEGPDTRDEGSVVGLTVADQARALDARVLVIARGYDSLLMDRILAFRRELGEAMLGVVFNIVPRGSMSYVTQAMIPALARLDVPVYGVLPEDRTLRSVSVQQVVAYLDGRLLSGQDHSGALVEHVVVGAMSVEAALDHLKRRERTALVTGGDRTDLLFAALANDEVAAATAAFILTGDLHPSARLLALAERKEVPVVLVPHDTRVATDMLDKVFGRVRYAQVRKIDRFNALFAEKFDFVRLARALGLD